MSSALGQDHRGAELRPSKRGLSTTVARRAMVCICLLGSSCRRMKPIGIMVVLNGKRGFLNLKRAVYVS